MTLGLRLLVEGHTVEIAGKDIGAGLKSVINRVAGGKNAHKLSSQDLIDRVNRWAEREIERRPRRRGLVRDKVTAITALANHHKTVSQILQHISRLYVNPEQNGKPPAEFHLSTIHKAKGREWPEVGILAPNLLPASRHDSTDNDQEANLAYVATTRPKQRLVYLR